MALSFYAREDLLAYQPGHVGHVGQAPRYIGRTLVAGTKLGGASYPATVDPWVVSDPDARTVDRLSKQCRTGAIWPADPETAAACGVAFTPVEFKDGAWQAAPVRIVAKEHRK